jgi:hypothetical protein
MKLFGSDMPVKAVDFVLKLNEPFKGRRWAIGWSGDENSSREMAEPHVRHTYLLENLPPPFFDADEDAVGHPQEFGTLFRSPQAILEAARAEAASDPAWVSAVPKFGDLWEWFETASPALRTEFVSQVVCGLMMTDPHLTECRVKPLVIVPLEDMRYRFISDPNIPQEAVQASILGGDINLMYRYGEYVDAGKELNFEVALGKNELTETVWSAQLFDNLAIAVTTERSLVSVRLCHPEALMDLIERVRKDVESIYPGGEPDDLECDSKKFAAFDKASGPLPRPLVLSDRCLIMNSADYGVVVVRLPVLDPETLSDEEIADLTAPLTWEDISVIQRSHIIDIPDELRKIPPMNVGAFVLNGLIGGLSDDRRIPMRELLTNLVLRLSLKLWSRCEAMALNEHGKAGIKWFLFAFLPGEGLQYSMGRTQGFLPMVENHNLIKRASCVWGEVSSDGRPAIMIWTKSPPEFQRDWNDGEPPEEAATAPHADEREVPSHLPLPLRLTDRSFLFISRAYGAIWVRIPELDPSVFSPSAIAEMTQSVSWDDIATVNVEGLSQTRYLGRVDAPIAAMKFICVNLMDLANHEHLHDEIDLIDQVMKMSLKLWTRCEEMAWKMERLRNVKEFIVMIEPDGVPQTSYSPDPEIENRVRFGNLLRQAKYVKYERYPDGRSKPSIAVWEDVPDMFMPE